MICDPMEYWCFFHNYLDRVKALSDEELGKLVRSLTIYSATGERTELPDNLTMPFDFLAVDIDQCHKKAKETSEKRKASADARWMQKDAKDANASKCIHTYTKTKTKTKDKYGSQNFDQKVIHMDDLDFLGE